MDTAKKAGTTIIYSAKQLQNMNQVERDKIRKNLICEVCGKKAIFRKESKDGRKACFSANHIMGCSMQNSKPSSGKTDNKENVNKKQVDDNLNIAFKNYFETVLEEDDNDLIDEFNKDGTCHRQYELEPTKTTHETIRLPRILHYAENNILKEQDVYIVIDNRRAHISDVTYDVSKLNKDIQENEGKLGFYWGYYLSSDFDRWINIDLKAPFNGFSIKVTEEVSNSIWNNLEKAAGTWKIKVPGIVYGKLKYASTNKPYVEIEDITKIYLDRRKYKKNIKRM